MQFYTKMCGGTLTMVGEACCNPSIRGKPELHPVTNLRPKHRCLTPTALVCTGAAGWAVPDPRCVRTSDFETEQRCDVWNVVTRRQWVKEWRFTVRYIKILQWDHRQRDRRKVNSNADMWVFWGIYSGRVSRLLTFSSLHLPEGTKTNKS